MICDNDIILDQANFLSILGRGCGKIICQSFQWTKLFRDLHRAVPPLCCLDNKIASNWPSDQSPRVIAARTSDCVECSVKRVLLTGIIPLAVLSNCSFPIRVIAVVLIVRSPRVIPTGRFPAKIKLWVAWNFRASAGLSSKHCPANLIFAKLSTSTARAVVAGFGCNWNPDLEVFPIFRLDPVWPTNCSIWTIAWRYYAGP